MLFRSAVWRCFTVPPAAIFWAGSSLLSLIHICITDSFEKTAAFRWLKEHCAEYGFILRFPKDKEDITGVTYES